VSRDEMLALSSTDHPTGTPSTRSAAPASLHLTLARREGKAARCRRVKISLYVFCLLGLGTEVAKNSQPAGKLPGLHTIFLFPSTIAGMQEGQGARGLGQVLLLAKKAVDENWHRNAGV